MFCIVFSLCLCVSCLHSASYLVCVCAFPYLDVPLGGRFYSRYSRIYSAHLSRGSSSCSLTCQTSTQAATIFWTRKIAITPNPLLNVYLNFIRKPSRFVFSLALHYFELGTNIAV